METTWLGKLKRLLEQPHCWEVARPNSALVVGRSEGTRQREWSRRNRHRHSYREILVPLSGASQYSVDGHLYGCGPGALVFIDSMVPHDNGYPPFSPPLEHLWVGFLPGHYTVRCLRAEAGRMAQVPDAAFTLSEEQVGCSLTQVWNKAVEDPPQAGALRLRSGLGLLLLTVCQTADGGTPEGRRTRLARTMEGICDHIRETAGRGDTLDTLAQLAGYSRFHFLRLFKKEMGCTPGAYIDTCRLQRYRQLQRQGLSMKEIGYALGFSSPSAFSRWRTVQNRKNAAAE